MFQGILFYKNLIIKAGLLDESVPSYQEWDTSLLLAKNGGNFFHIKDPLFIYNLHSGETISKDLSRDFNGYQYIINKYKYDIIKNTGIESRKNHGKIQYKKLLTNNFFDFNYNDSTKNNVNSILSDIELYFLEDTINNKENNNNSSNRISYIKNIIKRIIYVN